jgi:hypothetical protein
MALHNNFDALQPKEIKSLAGTILKQLSNIHISGLYSACILGH